ncbi:MAG TPA: helix-turn-helix domain-containing protein [Thermoleophilaceae bacterium]|nr:helix-turn-helix domain-containing protein [Thermoleophilaceae bacterium]
MPRRAKIRPDEPGREKLLDAGRDLFGTQGYEATSIADIGRRAGIAKSVLYHYFGSKAALYEELVRHDADALVAAVEAAVPTRAEGGPRLRPGVDAFLRFLSERPATWRLMTRDPPADPALRALHERVDAEVARALRNLLAMPAKVRAKPDVVELVALAVRTYAAWWQDHPAVPREDIVEAIGDFAAASARRIDRKTS